MQRAVLLRAKKDSRLETVHDVAIREEERDDARLAVTALVEIYAQLRRRPMHPIANGGIHGAIARGNPGNRRGADFRHAGDLVQRRLLAHPQM